MSFFINDNKNKVYIFFIIIVLFNYSLNVQTKVDSSSLVLKKDLLRNLKGQKYLDRCENMLTCDSCVNLADNCGWCFSDGLCKPGNEIAPTEFGACEYKDWETSKCRLRECQSYSSILSCVSQDNCFWCKLVDHKEQKIKGQCFDKAMKLEVECEETSDVENYMKTPKIFKEKATNNLLNDELESISNNDIYDESIKTDRDPQFLNYTKFLNQLKTWFKNKANIKPSIFNSIDNPAGIFSYQLLSNDIIQGSNFNTTKIKNSIHLSDSFDFKSYKSLSQAAKKEMINLSKRLSLDILKSMFIFKVEALQINAANFRGVKYYLLLESIAKETWVHYLKKFNIKLGELHKLLKIDKNADRNFTQIIKKQEKLSLIYPFKLESEEISYLKFPYNKWTKLPGFNITLKAYLNTTVLLFQKLRLFGKGNNFYSVYFHNEEELKSFSIIKNNKHFKRLELNNFSVQRLNPGLHNFYMAYKTDFKLNKNDENNVIMTNAIEFPYIEEDAILNKEADFQLDNYNSNKEFFEIKELKQLVKIENKNYSSIRVTRHNYLILYKIQTKMNENKNIFFKLKVRSLNGHLNRETASSQSILIPSLSIIQNIGGFSVITLPTGEYEISVLGKFILEEILQEKLIDTFNNNIDSDNQQILSDKILPKSFNSSYNVSMNSTVSTKTPITGKRIKKPVTGKSFQLPDNEEMKEIDKNMILEEITFKQIDPNTNRNIESTESNNDDYEENSQDHIKKKKKKKKGKKKKKENTNANPSNNTVNLNENHNDAAENNKEKFHQEKLTENITSLGEHKNNKNITKKSHNVSKDPQKEKISLNDNDFFKGLNSASNSIDSLVKVKDFLNLYDKITDSGKDSMQLKENSRYMKDRGEVSMMRLPPSSLVYSISFKDRFYFKGNNELNEIPHMKKLFKLKSEMNVIIIINIILTLPKITDFQFRLYVNGKEDCDSYLFSKNEHIISLKSNSIVKFLPGEYVIELLYLANKDGIVIMTDSNWDIISINLILLEIQ